MRANFAVSALFTAATFLSPAHASSILFAASATLPSNGVYGTSKVINLNDNAGSITAYGFDGIFSTPSAPGTVSVNGGNPNSPKNTGGAQDIDVSSAGIGLKSNDSPYIGPTDGIVLDFSNVKSSVLYNGQTGTESDVTFAMKVDLTGPSDWTVYGYSTSGVNAGKYVLLASGPMESAPGNGYTATPSFTTSALYSNYLIGETSDCALTITGIQVQYDTLTTTQQTPEPGTFVMAGMALIGLGMTMKKRGRKA